jgi:hypothetical protein
VCGAAIKQSPVRAETFETPCFFVSLKDYCIFCARKDAIWYRACLRPMMPAQRLIVYPFNRHVTESKMSKPKKACKGGCKTDFCHSAKKDPHHHGHHHHHGHKKPANDEKAPEAPKSCGCKSNGCCKP